jgi:putative endonuclease
MAGWFVYMARCADGSLYTGITTGPARRIAEHNHSDRLGARYTRSRRPVSLAWCERCDSRADAGRREHYIRNLDKGSKEALVREYDDSRPSERGAVSKHHRRGQTT